jgi:hypothetical protein
MDARILPSEPFIVATYIFHIEICGVDSCRYILMLVLMGSRCCGWEKVCSRQLPTCQQANGDEGRYESYKRSKEGNCDSLIRLYPALDMTIVMSEMSFLHRSGKGACLSELV